MAVGRTANRVAPVLLFVAAQMTVARWYLEPERTAVTIGTGLLLACMTAALLFAARYSGEDTARGRAGESLRSAVAFASLMLILSVGTRLAAAIGVTDDVDFSRRATMVMIGAFIMLTGNAYPKTLTPLSALRCEPAKVQAFQRYAGWTFTVIGLVYAIVWLALPIAVAEPVSMLALVSGMLLIVTRMLGWRRKRQRPA